MSRVVVAPSVSVDEDITAFVAQDQALSQEHPDLAPSDVEWAQVVAEVRNEYRRYTTTVSAPNHALSLATAAYMLHLCRAISARRVLDLGSGFSSWVLRHHAETASNPVDVVSVDTDEDWLAKTSDYLGTVAGLVTWDEFTSQTWAPFDLVLHDLAGGSLRETAATLACDLVAPDGVIVFDDVSDSSADTEPCQMIRLVDGAVVACRPVYLVRVSAV